MVKRVRVEVSVGTSIAVERQHLLQLTRHLDGAFPTPLLLRRFDGHCKVLLRESTVPGADCWCICPMPAESLIEETCINDHF